MQTSRLEEHSPSVPGDGTTSQGFEGSEDEANRCVAKALSMFPPSTANTSLTFTRSKVGLRSQTLNLHFNALLTLQRQRQLSL